MTDRVRVVLSMHDPVLRQRLRRLLERHASVSVVAECSTGSETISALREDRATLALLDAQMPDIGALELFEELGLENVPSLVVVTRLESSVLRALEVHAIPYLLRTFDDEGFEAVFRRAVLNTERRALAGIRRRLARMLAGDEEGSRDRRIPVRNAGKLQYVDLDDIRWVQGVGSFARLHLVDRTHVLKVSLDELAERFADDFVRIHSTLVRASEIAEIERTQEGEALVSLRDGGQLRVRPEAHPEMVQAS